jgi:uncharacterized membrane protein YjdF
MFSSNFFKASKLDIAFFSSTLLFAAAEFFADSSFWLIENARCFEYLGCNAGFLGYDATVHFFGGVFEAILIVWIGEKYLHLKILHDRFWKNALLMVMAVAFFAAVWEIYEFVLDNFAAYFFNHVPSLFNELAQPGNGDTVGDMMFGILGAVVGVLILRVVVPHILKRSE